MNTDLKIITMRDVRPEKVEFLWKPYIPKSKISLIQGDAGTGKTTMALAVAAAITTGAALPGGKPSAPADVVVQNAEDGLADTIVPRLARFGADVDRVHFIDEGERALSLADERIEQTIMEKGAGLCIFDPIQAYLCGADMHSANGIRPLMKRLAAVAGRTGCAIILIGHLNKKSGKAQYRGLGSIDIYSAARSVLTVGKIDLDESMRAVVHNKYNLSVPGASLAFGFDESGGFTWLGDYDISIEELLGGNQKQPEGQFAKARRLIGRALANGPVPSVEMEQLAEDNNISMKTFHRAKSALGVIAVNLRGRWHWEMPVEVEYTEVSKEGHGRDGQGGQAAALPTLSTSPGKEAV